MTVCLNAFVQSVNVGWREVQKIYMMFTVKLTLYSYERLLAVCMGYLKHTNYGLGQPQEKRTVIH